MSAASLSGVELRRSAGRFFAVPFAVVAVGAAQFAAAAPVEVTEGVVDTHYETPGGGDDRRFNFSGPGADTLNYQGSPLPGEELGGVPGDVLA